VPGLLPDVDREGLLEYSVVYTDRSINHMSQRFQGVMRDISSSLKSVYNAKAVVIVPGSGTFGMEAVARQFATSRKCLVIRNGWFSFRWSQIFDMGGIPSESTVLKNKGGRPLTHRLQLRRWSRRSRQTSPIWSLRRMSKPHPG
jgi:aspartate aminotransferase-like enzyme